MYVLGFLWIDSNIRHSGDGRGSPNDLHIMVVECGTELVLCDASRLTEGVGPVPRLRLTTHLPEDSAAVGQSAKHGPTFNRDISLANTASGIYADGKARKFTCLV